MNILEDTLPLLNAGKVTEAYARLQTELNSAREAGNDSAASLALHLMGRVGHMLGRTEEARLLTHEALEIQRRLGDRAGQNALFISSE